MLMKALQLVRPRCFEAVQLPMPQLPPENRDRLIVRTAWVSLCGSDIPFFTGGKRRRTYPLDPGVPIHECIGEVVESACSGFRPGDLVISMPDGNQGLAEYFLAQASRTLAIGPGFADIGAACMIQPISTVINAIDQLGDLSGKSIAVVGLGFMGQMFCWLARKRGAAKIIGIDPNPQRCQTAKSLGATRKICKRGIEVVHEFRTNFETWDSPDVCVEAVGHQMNTINDCLELVRKRGSVLAFGVPDHEIYAIEFEVFFRKNARLIAAVTPDWTAYLPKSLDLYKSCELELAPLVTHRFAIRDAQKAFEMYERHEDGILKAVLDATDW